MVKYLVAIEMPRVRFPDGALFFSYFYSHIYYASDSFISLFYIKTTIYLSKTHRLLHTTTFTLAFNIFDPISSTSVTISAIVGRSKVDRYSR